jgi:hypothetical protein
MYMATKFSRYLLALAEIATKINLLTCKYLIANALNFFKNLLGLPIENSDPILWVPRCDNKINNNYYHTSVVSQGHSMMLDATFELVL